MRDAQYRNLARLLAEVRSIVTLPDTDVAWSRFSTVDDLLNYLEVCTARLTAQDTSVLHELELFFGPTGALQEISLSSGWGEEFLTLSNRFDALIQSM